MKNCLIVGKHLVSGSVYKQNLEERAKAHTPLTVSQTSAEMQPISRERVPNEKIHEWRDLKETHLTDSDYRKQWRRKQRYLR
jgi:hypothetical protein